VTTVPWGGRLIYDGANADDDDRNMSSETVQGDNVHIVVYECDGKIALVVVNRRGHYNSIQSHALNLIAPFYENAVRRTDAVAAELCSCSASKMSGSTLQTKLDDLKQMYGLQEPLFVKVVVVVVVVVVVAVAVVAVAAVAVAAVKINLHFFWVQKLLHSTTATLHSTSLLVGIRNVLSQPPQSQLLLHQHPSPGDLARFVPSAGAGGTWHPTPLPSP
jgi:hypothetical protein